MSTPVKDRVKSIQKSQEIADKFMLLITEEIKSWTGEDDPSEHIYLLAHIAGIINSKICITLEGYGKVYGIPKLTCEEAFRWSSVISKEFIKTDRHLLKEIIDSANESKEQNNEQ